MIIHNTNELALLVKQQRKKMSLNQSDIGSQVGLQQKTVSAFENNPAATKLETLFKLLSAADLEVRIQPKNTPKDSDQWQEEW
ncbi:MAG: helix-turn-helix domain-containing protein [Oleibacter sp.]|nr:helix-turn-helix domain-containing protein [Thalassolituus sp.]